MVAVVVALGIGALIATLLRGGRTAREARLHHGGESLAVAS
jgi:hypothetical protein